MNQRNPQDLLPKHFTARSILLFLLLGLFFPRDLPADEALGAKLEANYERYRKAIATRDYGQLSQSLSSYKLMVVRNNVVSLKQPFPDAVFQLEKIFRTPSLAPLRLLRAESRGATARSIYYGPVDVGYHEPGTVIPDNLLVLQFIQEKGGWKFSGLDAISISGQREIHEMARRRDTSFIDRDAHVFPRLTGVAPAVPKPCPKPDYVGSMSVVSEGFDTSVDMNRIHLQQASDSGSNEVIMGGIRSGDNPISIRARPIEGAKTRRLEVTVSVVPLGGEPFEIFSYKPDPDQVMEFYNGLVRATASSFSRRKQ